MASDHSIQFNIIKGNPVKDANWTAQLELPSITVEAKGTTLFEALLNLKNYIRRNHDGYRTTLAVIEVQSETAKDNPLTQQIRDKCNKYKLFYDYLERLNENTDDRLEAQS